MSDFCVEGVKLFRGDADNPEGLQVAFSAVHGEHHFNRGMHGAGGKIDRQAGPQAFFKTIGYLQQASGDGELVKFGEVLASILQFEGAGDGPAQIGAGSASLGA